MKFTTIAATALSLALLAACGKNDQRPASSGSSAAPRNEASPSTQNTPANMGTPSTAQRETPPTSQQVDPKEPAQNKDFKSDGK